MKKVIVLLFLLTSVGLVYGQTIEELRDSMAAGNLNMQVELGVRYIEGDGVEQDCQEGLRLIRDAVDKGNRYGELRLGLRAAEPILSREMLSLLQIQMAIKWICYSIAKTGH